MSGRQYLFKVLLLGDGAVGKTSIRERYMGRGFKGSYLKTIGADFASKKLTMGDTQITMQIFDLAGQDAYVTARKAFYKGGRAAFLVFDLQDETTLVNLRQWAKDAIEFSQGSISTFVVLGNKADLVETRMVSKERAVQFCRQLSAETGLELVYLETSAKTGQNIKEAFDLLAYTLLREANLEIPPEVYTPPDVIEIIKPGGITESPAKNAKVVEQVAEIQEDLLEILRGLEQRVIALETSNQSQGNVHEKMDHLEAKVSELEERIRRMGHVLKTVVDSLKK